MAYIFCIIANVTGTFRNRMAWIFGLKRGKPMAIDDHGVS